MYDIIVMPVGLLHFVTIVTSHQAFPVEKWPHAEPVQKKLRNH